MQIIEECIKFDVVILLQRMTSVQNCPVALSLLIIGNLSLALSSKPLCALQKKSSYLTPIL